MMQFDDMNTLHYALIKAHGQVAYDSLLFACLNAIPTGHNMKGTMDTVW